MEEPQSFWYWKNIKISVDLIGETITKGSGYFEKEYTYIKIPDGYGYDNYCFLLSNKLVDYRPIKNYWYFSICFDMKIELIYDPEFREPKKNINGIN